jgi:hypothetical protein
MVMAIAGACVAALLAAVFFIAVNMTAGGKYIFPEHTYIALHDVEEDNTIIAVDSKALSKRIDGNVETRRSAKGNLCVARGVDGDSRPLYSITDDGISMITDYASTFQVASEGGAVAYKDRDGALFLYSVKDKKISEITSDEVADFVISPDGGTILFSAKRNEGMNALYASRSGKTARIASNGMPIAVADKGARILYNDPNNSSLYATDIENEGKRKLASDFLQVLGINTDKTEIIFSGQDRRSYIFSMKGEKEKLSNSELTYASPYRFYSEFYYIVSVSSNTKGFLDSVFYDESNNVFYINDKFESEKLASKAEGLTVSFDGKIVHYLKSKNLYKRAIAGDGASEKLAGDVVSFVATNNGDAAYFVNDDYELAYVRGDADKAKKIADDVYPYSLSMTSGDTLLFITDYSESRQTGTLQTAKNGEKRKRVADDVYRRAYADSNITMYFQKADDDHYDVYVSDGDVDFKKLASDVALDFN